VRAALGKEGVERVVGASVWAMWVRRRSVHGERCRSLGVGNVGAEAVGPWRACSPAAMAQDSGIRVRAGASIKSAFYRRAARGRVSWGEQPGGGAARGKCRGSMRLSAAGGLPWRRGEQGRNRGRVVCPSGAREERSCGKTGGARQFGRGAAKWCGQVASAGLRHRR
jgi:hypothetical protein